MKRNLTLLLTGLALALLGLLFLFAGANRTKAAVFSSVSFPSMEVGMIRAEDNEVFNPEFQNAECAVDWFNVGAFNAYEFDRNSFDAFASSNFTNFAVDHWQSHFGNRAFAAGFASFGNVKFDQFDFQNFDSTVEFKA